MIATPEPEHPDDLLTRAEAALRRLTVPEGPSRDAVMRSLTVLHAASGLSPPVPRRRWRAMRFAAAVMAAAICCAAGIWLLRPATAFGEVARKLRDARTLTYRTTMQIAGQPASITSRMLIKAPGLLRCETEPAGGAVSIFDAERNRTLVLDPTTKSAVLMEPSTPPTAGTKDMVANEFEGLRKLAESRSEPVGRRRIGRIEAEGYHVRQGWQDMVVWIDPGAKLPLRIDISARVNGLEITGSLEDFQFDPPLDDALFRLEPPADYTLTKGQNAGMSTDEAIADLLRRYAARSGGAFPPRFDDVKAYAKQLRDGENDNELSAEAVRLVQTIARVQVFLLEHERDYGYKSEGVKLGDRDKILLWYRPKGSNANRVIYGDLHAADATPGQVPEPTRP
jgi:outer membrane lipoprotein-sorting protein